LTIQKPQDTITIGKWEVPKQMFDDYVKFSDFADGYLMKKIETPSGTEYERQRRWGMCVQQMMQIHREICKHLKIEYSTEHEDDFYKVFHTAVRETKKI